MIEFLITEHDENNILRQATFTTEDPILFEGVLGLIQDKSVGCKVVVGDVDTKHLVPTPMLGMLQELKHKRERAKGTILQFPVQREGGGNNGADNRVS